MSTCSSPRSSPTLRALGAAPPRSELPDGASSAGGATNTSKPPSLPVLARHRGGERSSKSIWSIHRRACREKGERWGAAGRLLASKIAEVARAIWQRARRRRNRLAMHDMHALEQSAATMLAVLAKLQPVAPHVGHVHARSPCLHAIWNGKRILRLGASLCLGFGKHARLTATWAVAHILTQSSWSMLGTQQNNATKPGLPGPCWHEH